MTPDTESVADGSNVVAWKHDKPANPRVDARADRLRIAVSDAARRAGVPIVLTPDEERERGRGLLLARLRRADAERRRAARRRLRVSSVRSRVGIQTTTTDPSLRFLSSAHALVRSLDSAMRARPDIARTATAQRVELSVNLLPDELVSLVHGVDDLAALDRRIDDVLDSRRWTSALHSEAARANILKVLEYCHAQGVDVSDYDALIEDGWEYGGDALDDAVRDVLDGDYDDGLRRMVEDVIFGPLPQLDAPVTAPALVSTPNPPLAPVRALIRSARARASRRRSSVSVSSPTSTTNRRTTE